MAADGTRRRCPKGGPVASAAVSPDQRPSRVTPSKKQLAAEANERKAGKGRRTTTKATTPSAGSRRASGSRTTTSVEASASAGAAREAAPVVAPPEPDLPGNRWLDALLPRSPERFIVREGTVEVAEGAGPPDGRRYGWVAIVIAWFGAQILAGLSTPS